MIYQNRKVISVVTKLIGILTLVFSVFCSAQQDTDEISDIERVQRAAEEYARQVVAVPDFGEIVLEAAHIDSRLKVSACESGYDLTTSGTAKSSGVTVLVKCPTEGWQVYVPVRATVTVPLVVASLPIASGQLITENDLSIEFIEQRAYRRQGFYSLDAIVGSKAKRALRAGQVVERKDVCAVCRGDTVVINATMGEMTITTRGEAMRDGAVGEQVKVKNSKSQRIIDATVSGIGEVSVRF
jgi:flagella basal body P-ring formation protein FlgA